MTTSVYDIKTFDPNEFVIEKRINMDDVLQIREAFDLFDEGDGVVNVQNVKDALDALGILYYINYQASNVLIM